MMVCWCLMVAQNQLLILHTGNYFRFYYQLFPLGVFNYLKMILLLTNKCFIRKWVIKAFISIHSELRRRSEWKTIMIVNQTWHPTIHKSLNLDKTVQSIYYLDTGSLTGDINSGKILLYTWGLIPKLNSNQRHSWWINNQISMSLCLTMLIILTVNPALILYIGWVLMNCWKILANIFGCNLRWISTLY